MKNSIYKLADKYKNLSIFLKITINFELILITTLVFVALFVTDRFTGILKEKEIALGDTKVEKLADFMQEEYNRIYSLGIYIHNGDISKIMSKIIQDKREAYDYNNISDIQIFFSGISYADANISDMILVSTQGNVYSYTRNASYDVKPSYDFSNRDKIKAFLKSDDNTIIFYDDPTDYCLKKKETVISFVGKIYDSSLYPKKKIVGIYIMNIPLENIDMILDMASGDSKGELLLINEQEEVIYGNDRSKCNQSYDESTINVKDVYRSTKNVGTSGLRIEYVLSEKILFSEISSIRNQMIIILVFSIFITLIFSVVIYHVFNKKVKVLLESMEKVQRGNFQAKIPIESQDEIGVISESFNEMCDKLNTYIKQVYISKIQRKNAEINALQTQIDPHFLYNTLESIKAKALEQNAEDTAEMIAILGHLFRWSSRTKDKIVYLDQEIEYIKNYLVLQSYRYNQQLEINIDIKDSYLSYAIPKLILQPIVENVIKHALDNLDRDKLVGIHARKKDSNLELTVYDNGIGITEEKLHEICDKLQTKESQDDFESIGIQNVNQRLLLMFGNGYGLQIRSIENMGTAVKVCIPVMSKEEMSSLV